MDVLKLLVERYLSAAHKLASLRPKPPQVFVWLKPEVEGEVDRSVVNLLSIGLPAGEFRKTYGSDFSGGLNELGPDGVPEALVSKVWNDRSEVVSEEVEAVAGVEAGVCQQIDRVFAVNHELNCQCRCKARYFIAWKQEVALRHSDQA